MPASSSNSPIREKILSSATRLFASKGFEGTSIQEISDAVGIRKPSLLYHFPSKEELRLAVLSEMLEHWNRTIPSLLAATTSGADEFRAVFGALLGFFTEAPDRARLLLRELLDRPEEVRALLAERVRPWIDLVATRIHRGQERGSIRAEVDAEAYIAHVINLVLAAISTRSVLELVSTSRHEAELLRIAHTSLFASGDQESMD